MTVLSRLRVGLHTKTVTIALCRNMEESIDYKENIVIHETRETNLSGDKDCNKKIFHTEKSYPHIGKELLSDQERFNKMMKAEVLSCVYPMKSTPRGFALIINNSDFQPESGFGPRHGSNVDVKNLDDLFQYLGFKVFVKQNLGVATIVNETGVQGII